MSGLKGKISSGEPWPEARIRILIPKYMEFDNSSLVTNYTTGSNNLTVVAYNSSHTVIDIIFPAGILFVDIISLNFSIFIDPNSMLAVGKGTDNSTLVMYTICRQAQFLNYPSNPSTDFKTCGGMATTTIITVVPGMLSEIKGYS